MARRKNPTAKHDALEWFLRSLHHLGWPWSTTDDPQPLEESGRGPWSDARLSALALPDGQTLLAVATPDSLETMDRSFAAFEDLTDAHRALQAALRQRGIEGRMVIVLSASGQGQLLDLVQEELLLACDNKGEVSERLLPLLETSALVRGSLTNLPRRPLWKRASELQKWVRLWESRISGTPALPRATVEQFFHWLLLSRLAEETGLLVPAPCPFSRVGISTRAVPPARLLESAWVPLHRRHNLLQGARLADMLAIAKGKDRQAALAECLASFSRLSRAKFSADLFIEAFMDEPWRQLSWRSAQRELPSVDAEGPWQLAPWDWDADASPEMPVLRAFDLVTEHARERALYLRAQQQRGELAGVQLDVFGEAAPPLTEEDAALFTLQEGLRTRTRERTRAAVLRLALLAHGVQWCARLGKRDPIFPPAPVALEAAPDVQVSAPKKTAAHLAALN